MKSSTEDIIQMFLFRPVVFACAGDLETKQVTIEFETLISIADNYRGVVYSQKELAAGPLVVSWNVWATRGSGRFEKPVTGKRLLDQQW